MVEVLIFGVDVALKTNEFETIGEFKFAFFTEAVVHLVYCDITLLGSRI